MVVLLASFSAGCSRAYYRQQADQEVYCLIDQRSIDPRWPVENFTIEPDPRSRTHDPYPPDCPPMPVDDPVSHRLMHCVDSKHGWLHGRRYPQTGQIDNPAWESYLVTNDDGTVVLDRHAAIQLALLHSREYQQSSENLYLSALGVTLERFRFDTQFFGGNDTEFRVSGPLSGDANSSSTLSNRANLGFDRAFAAGGQFMAEVANSVVWQFAEPDGYDVTTPIRFTLLQPLLRQAGRAVVLEDLTDSERALLANIRQLERFRRGFYVETITGRSAGPGPSPSGIGLGTLSPGGGGSVSGYFSLLEQQIQIRNQRNNVAALRLNDLMLRDFRKFDRITQAQVDELRQNLYSSQVNLRVRDTRYKEQLDNYKISLGLPPELDVKIEDDMLDSFYLLSPELTELRGTIEQLLERLRAWEDRSAQGQAISADQNQVFAEFQKELPEKLQEVARQSRDRFDQVDQGDLEKLVEAIEIRRKGFRWIAGFDEVQRGEIDSSLVDVEALEGRPDNVKAKLDKLKPEFFAAINALEPAQNDTAPAAIDVAQQEQRRHMISLLTRLSDALLQLSLIQAEARLDAAPSLVPVKLGMAEDLLVAPDDSSGIVERAALELARHHRRDWMNGRAALVDQWRQIEVVANNLRSDLDVSVEGDITPRSSSQLNNVTGSLAVGLAFDGPLNRRAERNAYRRTLINYQRARRQYYAYEDRVSNVLRATLRSMRSAQLEFELQREGVRVAIRRVDQQRERLFAPPRVGQEEVSLGATTVRDIVNSLNSLLNAQNSFLSSWLKYESLRMSLDFDMGTLELDELLDGILQWQDPHSFAGGRYRTGGQTDQMPPDLEPFLPNSEPVLPDADARFNAPEQIPPGVEVLRLPPEVEVHPPNRLPVFPPQGARPQRSGVRNVAAAYASDRWARRVVKSGSRAR